VILSLSLNEKNSLVIMDIHYGIEKDGRCKQSENGSIKRADRK
jgi:hypothetical protein